MLFAQQVQLPEAGLGEVFSPAQIPTIEDQTCLQNVCFVETWRVEVAFIVGLTAEAKQFAEGGETG
ncbi:hypothetical protein JT26_00250 [Porphyromonas sp. COT-108 OH1349]|nr:hypothetical protein JT26_00250 [Porphyromonas sp. COT-108 OH1349]